MSTKIFDGILLVCDMDGTLLDSKSQISRENQAALDYFVRHGGLFTVATGRMEGSLRRFLPSLPINVPSIFYNGALIYDLASQKILWEARLPEAVKPLILDLCNAFPGLGVEIFHYSEVHFPYQNCETEKHRCREAFLPRVTPLDQVPFPWIKIILAEEPGKLPAVESYLAGPLAHAPDLFRTVYSEPQFLELLPAGASKGDALRKLLQIMARQDLKVVAMGDHLNDLEMIETADRGIAVANAHPRLKKAARYRYGHHDQHAVAQVVEHLERGVI